METGEIIQDRIEYWQNKYYETQQELNSLKEIEKSHKEENGKLRVELEQEKEKNKELSDKLTEKNCKGAEEEILQKLNKYMELINKGYCDDCNELNVICGKSCNGSKNVKNAIESLIKIYKQEKEKNEELEYQNKILQEKNQDYKCNYDTMAKQKEKALEKVKQLEEHQKQYLDGELITAKQGKFFEKMIKENYIRKDKIKEKMEQTKKVYDEEMKPYMIEVGNSEKVLNVTYLSKKEKEELINKRNCLLVQIKTYEMLLEEK